MTSTESPDNSVVKPPIDKQLPPQPTSESVWGQGFMGLSGVSFLGAANDNILKQVLTLMVVAGGLWANAAGQGTQSVIALALSLPFIFLSGYAGQLADKFSKRQVIYWVKVAEIPIVLLAFLGFYLENFWILLFTMLLLGIQSSFYGPAKFGIIPDLVGERNLSKANGIIIGVTNIGVIFGMVIAGPLADVYHPVVKAEPAAQAAQEAEADPGQAAAPQPAPAENDEPARQQPVNAQKTLFQKLPIGVALLAVAVLGLIAALGIPHLTPAAPQLRFSGDLLGPHLATFEDANRALRFTMFSWSGFYLIASLALLVLPEFRDILGVTSTAITNLLGLLSISIVIGSCLVGFASGPKIRPIYSVVGSTGMAVCFIAMGVLPPTYGGLAVIVFLIGISAGFYIVPLQGLMQSLSPDDERGRFFGTANALSFVFISGAAVVYYVLAWAGLNPQRISLACSLFAVIGTAVAWLELRSAADQVKPDPSATN